MHIGPLPQKGKSTRPKESGDWQAIHMDLCFLSLMDDPIRVRKTSGVF